MLRISPTVHTKSGEKIVAHCRMGIGRTSLVIAVTLLKTGYNNEDVFELITKKRTLKVPDTKEQLNWVKALKKN